MSPPLPLLTAQGIAKSYGPVVALRSVDFAVAPGEVHALLGANGAGKSTLVKILAGVHPADAGQVFVAGRPVQFTTPRAAIQAGIATVFQDPALLPDLTVDENLRLGRVDRQRFQEGLDRFGLAHLDLDTRVRDLPLDLLRLVDLSRALSREPRILLLDEITAALTADQAERIFELLQDWRQQGRAAVLITHRLAEVMRACDRATVLRDGQDVAVLDTRAVDEHRLIEAMLGQATQPAAQELGSRQDGSALGPVVLQVEELGWNQGIQEISFQVREGEILGLVALEGQGQDRLFQLLAGQRRPTAGQIRIDGRPRRFRSPYDAVRAGVVLVPGDRQLAVLPSQSVHHNLALPLFHRLRHWMGIPQDEGPRVAETIRRLAIDIRAGSQVRRLSGGNQQKVVIGRWLVGGFRVLLCFDPTRGIDIQTKREIYRLLRELAGAGASILLYTSELAEIPLVCHRVLVMHAGRIVDEQEAATATEASLLTAAHGLEVAP